MRNALAGNDEALPIELDPIEDAHQADEQVGHAQVVGDGEPRADLRHGAEKCRLKNTTGPVLQRVGTVIITSLRRSVAHLKEAKNLLHLAGIIRRKQPPELPSREQKWLEVHR